MAPGVLMVDGMSLQIPPGGLVVSLGDHGEPQMSVDYLLRLDLWPTWLEIGCRHASSASEVTTKLRADLDDATKSALVKEEMQQAVVAVTAFAFAIDGFYSVLQQEMGRHPHSALWHKKRREGKPAPPRHAQVVETLKHHLKLRAKYAANLRTLIEQLFEFRTRGVHPKADFVRPNYRPELDSAVHPHLITFSGPHAVQTRALVLVALDGLVDRAIEIVGPEVDRGWLTKGREELDRLIPLYRVPGDDVPAWSDYLAAPESTKAEDEAK